MKLKQISDFSFVRKNKIKWDVIFKWKSRLYEFHGEKKKLTIWCIWWGVSFWCLISFAFDGMPKLKIITIFTFALAILLFLIKQKKLHDFPSDIKCLKEISHSELIQKNGFTTIYDQHKANKMNNLNKTFPTHKQNKRTEKLLQLFRCLSNL